MSTTRRTSRRDKSERTIGRADWSRLAVAAAAAALVSGFGLTAAADSADIAGYGLLPAYRSSEGWYNDAAVATLQQDWDEARRLARKAVDASPLSQPAARLTGEIELAAGEPSAAARNLRLAGLLGWRDAGAQARIMVLDAQEGKLAAALQRLDALQRRRGVTAETQQAAAQLLSEKQIADAFLDVLAADPPWRPAMFAATEFLDEKGAERFAFALDRLKSTRTPPRLEETNAVLRRLAQLDAGETLAQYAPRLVGPKAGRSIADPDFRLLEAALGDSDLVTGPFAWTRGPAQATTINAGPTSDKKNNSLLVRSRSRVPVTVVYQTLILPAGSYQLEYLSRRKAVSGDGDFSWAIRCDKTILPVQQEVAQQSENWVNESIRFTLPDHDCPIQRILLRSGRNLSGASVEGEFRQVTLSRL